MMFEKIPKSSGVVTGVSCMLSIAVGDVSKTGNMKIRTNMHGVKVQAPLTHNIFEPRLPQMHYVSFQSK